MSYVYLTKNKSRIIIDEKCTKHYSDGREKVVRNYAVISPEKLNDIRNRYSAMVDENENNIETLSKFLEKIDKHKFRGEDAIFLYLYRNKQSLELRGERVRLIKEKEKDNNDNLEIPEAESIDDYLNNLE